MTKAEQVVKEQEKWDLKLRKLDAEILNLVSETSKLNSENRWYPAVVASGATLVIVAIVKVFL